MTGLAMSFDNLIRGRTTQLAVWSEAVVIVLERLYFFHRIVQGHEPIYVQTLVSETPIE